jgi:hypothetical protein
MRDTVVDLEVGDEGLGVSEPVGDDTSVFQRAGTNAYRSANSNVVRRADTAEPTLVFARPSSMYPLASAGRDDSASSSGDFDDAPPLTLDETCFDADAIVHRFDTVPAVNANTRVVMRPRLVKSAAPPMVRMENMSRRAG